MLTRPNTDFLLDPEIIFLNHGSFGACPRPVFKAYQAWQRELERQPVEFLGRRVDALLAASRARLAAYLHAAPDEVVYFPNPTTALNVVVRSLSTPGARGGAAWLGPGDEILTTDHEYGAMDRTWRFLCGKTGARYVQRAMPLPLTTHADFVERFWAGVTPRTRAIFISHITSPTALIFPVAQICERARSAGILTIVDGAHAPGQVPLDLDAFGADFYAGACHKWLCGPKGAAFLYARRAVQPLLEPLVVSWGWESERPGPSPFVDHHEWQGTRDIAAYLSVAAAIDYQAEHDWPSVRARCHSLAVETRRRLASLTGAAPLTPEGTEDEWLGQMFAAQLPVEGARVEAIKARLYDDYRIEVPLLCWDSRPLMRVSLQTYNTGEDADTLLHALSRIIGA